MRPQATSSNGLYVPAPDCYGDVEHAGYWELQDSISPAAQPSKKLVGILCAIANAEKWITSRAHESRGSKPGRPGFPHRTVLKPHKAIAIGGATTCRRPSPRGDSLWLCIATLHAKIPPCCRAKGDGIGVLSLAINVASGLTMKRSGRCTRSRHNSG